MSTVRKNKIVTVTPELAQRWLNCNTHNRPLRNHHVAKLASAMKAGEWILTAEPIAFSKPYTDAQGNEVRETLINGQHRLWAVIESGVSCEFTVWWGCDPEEFSVIDQGAQRTFGDVLATTRQDVADPTLVASVCSSFIHYALGLNKSAEHPLRISHIDMLLAGVPESVSAAVDYKKRLRKFAPRPVISSLMLAHIVNPSMADMIVNQLKDAVGFTERDPIRALHLYISDNLVNPNKDSSAALNYKTCHALAARMRGEHIRVLKITGEGLGWMRDGARGKIGPLVQEIFGKTPHNFYTPKLIMEG